MLKTFFAKPRKANKRDISNIDVTYRNLTVVVDGACNLYSVALRCTNGIITFTANSPFELTDYVENLYKELAPNVAEPINFYVKNYEDC